MQIEQEQGSSSSGSSRTHSKVAAAVTAVAAGHTPKQEQ